MYKILSIICIIIGIIPFFLLPKKFYPLFILLLAPIIMLSVKLYKRKG
ncbi:hypothetical protein C8P70_11234 [Myroides indicus]|uniref:Uncharacterized protein n=1 Tax=Myroides indicus TaxID=1323422 RepID=A0A4R7F4H1_9FLAO|nr:hypothetical protein C8P70_11234 [Myroides indicus]